MREGVRAELKAGTIGERSQLLGRHQADLGLGSDGVMREAESSGANVDRGRGVEVAQQRGEDRKVVRRAVVKGDRAQASGGSGLKSVHELAEDHETVAPLDERLQLYCQLLGIDDEVVRIQLPRNVTDRVVVQDYRWTTKQGDRIATEDRSDGQASTHSVVRNIARNTGFQVLGEGISKLASLALYVVVARVAGPAQFGVLVFCLSLSLLTTVVASFGVEGLLIRGVARDQTTARALLRDAITIKLGFGSIGIVVAVVVTVAAGDGPYVRVAIAGFALGAVIDLIARSYYAIFQALDDMRPTAVCILLQRFTTAAMGIVFVLAGGRIVALAVAFVSGSILALVAAAVKLAARGVTPLGRPSLAGARRLAHDSFALGLSQAFNTILFRVDATMLSLIKGNAAVGLYGVAYRLLESTLFLTYDFTAALAPTLARLGRTTQPTIARAFEMGCRVLALMLVPIGDVMVAFPGPIVHLVYGARYGAAAGVMRVLGVGSVTYGFAYLASVVLISQDRDSVLSKVHAAVAAQNVVLNLILIPPMSYLGAALSTTISETTRAVVLMWYAVRSTGPIRIARVFLAPMVGSAAVALVALVAGSSLVTLVLAMMAYLGLAVAVERFAFPADARFLRDAVLRRGPTVTGLP